MDLYMKLAFLGLVAGAVSSGTAIGWGLITAPILLLVLRFPPQEGVVLSVTGALGYLLSLGAYRHLSGGIPWAPTLALTLGSFVGGLVGVAIADLLPAAAMKRIIGVMTIIAGVALLIPWKD
ncbi:MAG: TSUP family transporter [Candidatus Entotheonellia bacterium]